ncbi:hypothetical protein C8Q76DRAFT_731719 [Earliella scabrosa]|nr:hypothetical protein C8Q76DRAFT_731719 [Earliella scabrosa]
MAHPLLTLCASRIVAIMAGLAEIVFGWIQTTRPGLTVASGRLAVNHSSCSSTVPARWAGTLTSRVGELGGVRGTTGRLLSSASMGARCWDDCGSWGLVQDGLSIDKRFAAVLLLGI